MNNVLGPTVESFYYKTSPQIAPRPRPEYSWWSQTRHEMRRTAFPNPTMFKRTHHGGNHQPMRNRMTVLHYLA